MCRITMPLVGKVVLLARGANWNLWDAVAWCVTWNLREMYGLKASMCRITMPLVGKVVLLARGATWNLREMYGLKASMYQITIETILY